MFSMASVEVFAGIKRKNIIENIPQRVIAFIVFILKLDGKRWAHSLIANIDFSSNLEKSYRIKIL